MSVGTHSILAFLDVNGLATEASVFDREMPAFAAFNAPQSLNLNIFKIYKLWLFFSLIYR